MPILFQKKGPPLDLVTTQLTFSYFVACVLALWNGCYYFGGINLGPSFPFVSLFFYTKNFRSFLVLKLHLMHTGTAIITERLTMWIQEKGLKFYSLAVLVDA